MNLTALGCAEEVLAVKALMEFFGLPGEHVYKVEARIEKILGGMPFGLVYMENVPAYLVKRIREKG